MTAKPMKISRYKIFLTKGFKDFQFLSNGKEMIYKNRLKFFFSTFRGVDIELIAPNKFEIRNKNSLSLFKQTVCRIALSLCFVLALWGYKNDSFGDLFRDNYIKNYPEDNFKENTSTMFNDINSYIPEDAPRTATGEIDYSKAPMFWFAAKTSYVITEKDRFIYTTNPKNNIYGVVYSLINEKDEVIWQDTLITLPGCYAKIDIYDLLSLGTHNFKLRQKVIELNDLTSVDTAKSSVSYDAAVTIIKK